MSLSALYVFRILKDLLLGGIESTRKSLVEQFKATEETRNQHCLNNLARENESLKSENERLKQISEQENRLKEQEIKRLQQKVAQQTWHKADEAILV